MFSTVHEPTMSMCTVALLVFLILFYYLVQNTKIISTLKSSSFENIYQIGLFSCMRVLAQLYKQQRVERGEFSSLTDV